MKTFFTMLLLISSTILIHAQKIYQDGSITLRSGEQLEGYIFADNFDRGEREILFKTTKNEAAQSYLPQQISAFQINDRRYVVRMIKETIKNSGRTQVVEEDAYLEQLEAGKLNLYQYAGRMDNWLYIENPQGQMAKLLLIRYYTDTDDPTKILQRDTMGMTKYREKGAYKFNKVYIRQLQQLTQGCQQVAVNPKTLELKAATVRKIIRKYNECHDREFATETFKRKKASFYAVGGVIALPLFSDSDSLLRTYEIGGELFLPAVTDRISIGFHYSRGDSFVERINFLTDEPYYNPVALRRSVFRLNYYPFQGRRLQPYGSIGLSSRNYRESFRGRQIGNYTETSLFLAAGGQFQIHSRVKVQVEVGYPYFPVAKIGLGIRIF